MKAHLDKNDTTVIIEQELSGVVQKINSVKESLIEFQKESLIPNLYKNYDQIHREQSLAQEILSILNMPALRHRHNFSYLFVSALKQGHLNNIACQTFIKFADEFIEGYCGSTSCHCGEFKELEQVREDDTLTFEIIGTNTNKKPKRREDTTLEFRFGESGLQSRIKPKSNTVLFLEKLRADILALELHFEDEFDHRMREYHANVSETVNGFLKNPALSSEMDMNIDETRALNDGWLVNSARSKVLSLINGYLRRNAKASC